MRKLHEVLVDVFLVVVVVVMMWSMIGCVTLPVTTDAAAPDLGENLDDLGAFEPLQPQQGGLPLGYNERQCQWDACGGPLPDRNLLVDPVPYQER